MTFTRRPKADLPDGDPLGHPEGEARGGARRQQRDRDSRRVYPPTGYP